MQTYYTDLQRVVGVNIDYLSSRPKDIFTRIELMALHGARLLLNCGSALQSKYVNNFFMFGTKLVVALFFITMLFYCTTAQCKTVFCTNCSNTAIQLLEKIQSAQQLNELYKQVSEATQQTAHQLEIVKTTLNQYQNMLQNTMQLPQSVVSELKGQMTQLAQLTNQLRTQRGDLTSLGQIFNELFPGQETLSDLASPTTPEGVAQANAIYQSHWDEWSSKVDQAVEATFQLSGSQLNDIAQNSGEFQNYLNTLLQTPDGQMKALMAGNQLSALQIQETRQLRELTATAIQSGLQSQMKNEKESQMMQEHIRMLTKTDKLKNMTPKPDPF